MLIKKMAALLKVKKEEVEKTLSDLKEEYSARGLRLIQSGEEWQLVTAPESAGILEELVKGEFSDNLSRAALEVLAIVAYKGPLTRAEVEYIRGVNSVYSLRNLLMRGLVEKKDNPKDGRSHIYSVTFDFLRHFGLDLISKLPHYEEFHKADVPTLEEEVSEKQN
jgi:segregation and condensation protein B